MMRGTWGRILFGRVGRSSLVGLGVVGLGVAGFVASIVGTSPAGARASGAVAQNTIAIQASSSWFHAIEVDLTFQPETDFSWTLECGTTTSYGSVCRTGGASNGNTEPGSSFVVTGLSDATTYHVRAVATDGGGTTTWASDDASAATLTTAPPVIQFQSYSIADGGHITGEMDINDKGLDTSWYLAAGADLSNPETSATYLVPANDLDQDQLVTGGFSEFGLQLTQPVPPVLYLQLHASNAKGDSTSQVVTLTTQTTAITTSAPTTTHAPTTTTAAGPTTTGGAMPMTTASTTTAATPYRRASLSVTPSIVVPGGLIRIHGTAPRCRPGDKVSATSVALPNHPVSRVGAFTGRIKQSGAFSMSGHLRRPLRAGQYTITARCDGTRLGTVAHLRVRVR